MPDMKSLTIDGVKYDIVDETARNSVDLGLTNATVGQIAKITAVDASGKPTAWEPVDMAGEAGSAPAPELLFSGTAENVTSFSQDIDFKGRKRILFSVGGTKGDAAITIKNGGLYLDGLGFTVCYYTKFLDISNASYPKGCILQRFEQISDEEAQVWYQQYVTSDAPIMTTFQGNNADTMKTRILSSFTTSKQDGISFVFSAEVASVLVNVWGL